MNAEVKKLWIEDLRANPTLQGKHYLQSRDAALGESEYQFCCLGRLCVLAVAAGVIEPPRIDGFGVAWFGDNSLPLEETIDVSMPLSSKVLPTQVMEWAGLAKANPVISPNSGGVERTTAAAQNDMGTTFAKIADMIEATL